MKRLPAVFFVVLLLALFLVGCSNVPVPPPAAPGDQAAVDAAVAATLTAIVEVDDDGSGSSESTPQSEATTAPDDVSPTSVSTPEAPDELVSSDLVLPPSVTDFDPVIRPASSKGDPDAPVVIYEWSDYT